MDAREYYRTVADRSMLSKEEAADLTRAVLQTLAMRLSVGEARDLARQLPEPLADTVRGTAKRLHRLGLNDLIQQVSTRTGLNNTDTTAGVRAVLRTLRQGIDPKEFRDLMSQLPAEFARLLEAQSIPRSIPPE
ncbi:MAG: hypothetical protein JWR32_5097 [Mycobacterium sp.]|jgi:uncharacterized protein (DUF2267 family)|nr:hypothetical protein [Mycobacterium sp.]